MPITSIVVTLVFVCSAVTIVLLSFMLFRILEQTKLTRNVIHERLEHLQVATERLMTLLSGVDRLSERLRELNTQADQRREREPLSDDHLQVLMDLGKALEMGTVGHVEKNAADMQALLGSLSDVKAEDYSQWKQQNEERLNQALSARRQKDAEVLELKQRLEEARQMISDLRRSTRVAEANSQSADALRAKLDEQELYLSRTKERAIKAESSALTLRQELDKLAAQDQKNRAKTEQELALLRAQMDAIAQERQKLADQLEDLQGSMKRTLLEKDMIEDRLLELDETVHSNLPSLSAAEKASLMEPAKAP
jgi:DNA repair exonuclease SbcCD ATPase subunit